MSPSLEEELATIPHEFSATKESTESIQSQSTNPTSNSNSKKHEEYQYLDLIREILETGEHRPDRYLTSFHIFLEFYQI